MGMMNKGFKDYYKLKSMKDQTPTHLRLKATEPPVPHQVKVIGCSSLRGGGGELGTNKNLDLWLQLVYTKLKLKHAI